MTLLACAVLPVLLAGCGADADNTGSTVAMYDSLVIKLDGIDSVSVFDLLTENHRVDYISTGMGVFIKAIDSIENGSGVYWLYSVNDTTAQIAADRYITSDGDRIRWHFSKPVK